MGQSLRYTSRIKGIQRMLHFVIFLLILHLTQIYGQQQQAQQAQQPQNQPVLTVPQNRTFLKLLDELTN